MKRFLIPVIVAITCNKSLAQASSEYGMMAERGWNMLICAALTTKEDIRIPFAKKGLELGRVFLEANMDGKVERDDRYSWAAIQFIYSADPKLSDSLDFKLGATWGSAKSEVSKLIREAKIPLSIKEIDKFKEDRFRSNNCSLL